MKDFSSYARQIAEELMLKYPERASKEADECLHGYVLSNGRGAGFVFRPEKDADYYGIVSAANELWDKIEDYGLKVETYEGELHEWIKDERQRVYNIARDIVIEKIKEHDAYVSKVNCNN